MVLYRTLRPAEISEGSVDRIEITKAQPGEYEGIIKVNYTLESSITITGWTAEREQNNLKIKIQNRYLCAENKPMFTWPEPLSNLAERCIAITIDDYLRRLDATDTPDDLDKTIVIQAEQDLLEYCSKNREELRRTARREHGFMRSPVIVNCLHKFRDKYPEAEFQWATGTLYTEYLPALLRDKK